MTIFNLNLKAGRNSFSTKQYNKIIYLYTALHLNIYFNNEFK